MGNKGYYVIKTNPTYYLKLLFANLRTILIVFPTLKNPEKSFDRSIVKTGNVNKTIHGKGCKLFINN